MDIREGVGWGFSPVRARGRERRRGVGETSEEEDPDVGLFDGLLGCQYEISRVVARPVLARRLAPHNVNFSGPPTNTPSMSA